MKRKLLLLILLEIFMAHTWWMPQPGVSWQWQLQGEVDTSFDVMMYDIDLFDVTAQTIAKLHDQGRIVICYFSAGSFEDWRDDADSFVDELKSKKMDGWDEAWLDISKVDNDIYPLADIMKARLDLAKDKGCDGVEPDNVDSHTNGVKVVLEANGNERTYGDDITYEHQLTYNKFLATEAHKRDLSIGLKNDLSQIEDLVDNFDWALNEQCYQYEECDLLDPFIDAGKAVFGVEYSKSTDTFCPELNEKGFNWLKKALALKATPYESCTPDIGGEPQCGDNICSTGETCAQDCESTSTDDNQEFTDDQSLSEEFTDTVDDESITSQESSFEQESIDNSSTVVGWLCLFILVISII
eukprot:TRINITY_DN8788_c0_g1_i1.p1 TRINITY_DN8788_c0_g1~~TRINITY_DN8788_c0_g1_i1.p1  ORF type:complete len:355 (+),score=100.17 TRINITY_DN8788_c0_g1_i1:17-1081(+)